MPDPPREPVGLSRITGPDRNWVRQLGGLGLFRGIVRGFLGEDRADMLVGV